MTGIGLRVLPVALLLAFPAAACASVLRADRALERIHAHGALALDYFSSDRLLDNRNGFYGGTFAFSARPRVGESGYIYASARLTDPEIPARGATSTVRELFLTERGRQSMLRIGRQIVAWGRAVGVNPTDNLTPRDDTLLLPSTAAQRFGTDALLWNRYLGRDLTWTLFATPYFVPSVVPIPAVPGVSFVSQVPPPAFRDPEVAVKLDQTGGAFDWSVSVFHGFSLLPNLRSIPGTLPVLALHYDRLNVLGADADTQIGSRGLGWIEAAYIHPQHVDYSDPAAERPSLYAVVGAARALGGANSVNMQLVYRRVVHYVAPVAAGSGLPEAVAFENDLLNGALARNDYGVTAQVIGSWRHETVQVRVFEYVNLGPTNTYTRLTVIYQATDRIEETIGFENDSGPTQSYFGQLGRNRTVFAEWRYNFP